MVDIDTCHNITIINRFGEFRTHQREREKERKKRSTDRPTDRVKYFFLFFKQRGQTSGQVTHTSRERKRKERETINKIFLFHLCIRIVSAKCWSRGCGRIRKVESNTPGRVDCSDVWLKQRHLQLRVLKKVELNVLGVSCISCSG